MKQTVTLIGTMDHHGRFSGRINGKLTTYERMQDVVDKLKLDQDFTIKFIYEPIYTDETVVWDEETGRYILLQKAEE